MHKAGLIEESKSKSCVAWKRYFLHRSKRKRHKDEWRWEQGPLGEGRDGGGWEVSGAKWRKPCAESVNAPWWWKSSNSGLTAMINSTSHSICEKNSWKKLGQFACANCQNDEWNRCVWMGKEGEDCWHKYIGLHILVLLNITAAETAPREEPTGRFGSFS